MRSWLWCPVLAQNRDLAYGANSDQRKMAAPHPAGDGGKDCGRAKTVWSGKADNPRNRLKHATQNLALGARLHRQSVIVQEIYNRVRVL